MFDFLSNLDNVLLLLKALCAVGGVIALAAVVYILRTTFDPLIRIVHFMIAYSPGTRPNDLLAGLAYGVRLTAWAGILGSGMWLFWDDIMAYTKLDERGVPFVVTAGTTVVAGVFLAGLALHFLKPSTRVVEVPSPPIVIEKPVEKIVEKVVEKVVEKFVEVPAKPEIVSVGEFHGAWRDVFKRLPMFVLKQSGTSIAGTYAPDNWSGPYPFTGGKVMDNIAEFAVATKTQRIHYRFTLRPGGNAVVEMWYTVEDLMQMLAIANKTVRTAQQAYVLQLQFKREFDRVGQPVYLGLFYQLPEPSYLERR